MSKSASLSPRTAEAVSLYKDTFRLRQRAAEFLCSYHGHVGTPDLSDDIEDRLDDLIGDLEAVIGSSIQSEVMQEGGEE